MKILFLDNDGVICLSDNWGGRFKKRLEYCKLNGPTEDLNMPVEYRFDNFDKKAIGVLNKILEETGAEIVVSSDWRLFATLDELGEYYLSKGIIKKPIGVTKTLGECEQDPNIEWHRNSDSEQTRVIEITQWLKDHPEITKWVAVDDLHMGKTGHWSGPGVREWGLENFVWTPLDDEGIKQCGVYEKILNFLKDE
jgi:hypothetical protein